MDKAGHVKDTILEDGVIISEHGEDEMDMESEKEEEKPKAGGAFSNALSSLNVLRPGVYSRMSLRPEVTPQDDPSLAMVVKEGVSRVAFLTTSAWSQAVSLCKYRTKEN